MVDEPIPTHMPNASNSLSSRTYQLEMFEKAKNGNIIVCMDTGSGKTQIARLLIDHKLQHRPDALTWFLTQSQVLAEQQHAFLSSQLPAYSFRLITGLDNAEYWASIEVWQAALRGKHGVVSTAQILLDALGHAFVSLDDISLLVFDEAHHCIGKNPYNKIMQLQKRRVQEDQKCQPPHILGLTATVMIRDDLKLIDEVEANITAICQSPTLNTEEYRGFVHLPEITRLTFEVMPGEGSIFIPLIEAIVRNYHMEDDPTIARLQRSSNAHDKQKLEKIITTCKPPVVVQLRDLVNKATHLEEVLGSWAADRYVHSCISKLVASALQQLECLLTIGFGETAHLAKLLTPILTEFTPPSGSPHQNDLTPKVWVLLEHLQIQWAINVICVIFVERRAVAYALQDIIANVPGLQKYQSFPFVGSSNPLNRKLGDLTDLSIQQDAFTEFREGKRNLCIATQVLEEGIDVQACNLVVCFDPPLTAKSYIQRRGRARRADSVFVLMQPTRERTSQHGGWLALESEMKRLYAEDNRHFKEEGARQDDSAGYMSLGTIKGSEARVDVDSARQHLEHFCRTMGRRGEDPPRPLYLLIEENACTYSCKVVLPGGLPPQCREVYSSSRWSSEKAAKKDAALQAYKLLQDAGLLDEHLLSIHAKARRRLAYDRNIETREASVVASPCLDIWSSSRIRLAENDCLYANRISLTGHVTMLLLLPYPLRQMVGYRLYTISGGEAMVSIQPLSTRVGGIHRIAAKITKFLFHTILQRKLPGLLRDDYLLPYYLLPDLENQAWDEWLETSQTTTKFSDFSSREISEVVVRRHNDNIPYLHCPDKDNWKHVQLATIDAVRLHKAMDFTKVHSNTQSLPSVKALPVEECAVSGLAPGVARVMTYMPTIMHFVQLALRSQEASVTVLKSIDLDQTSTFCDAFVAPQAGAGNYQRLEYLGDVVLKYMACINVFCNNPTYTEGALDVAVDRLINNARLHRSTLELGLDKFLTTESFSGHTWTLAERTMPSRQLSTKVLADLIEALLGVAHHETACSDFTTVVKCLSLFLPEVTWHTPEMDIAGYEIGDIPAGVSASHIQNVQDLLGYQFRRQVLLAEALNHSSPNIYLGSYDRLEFLGDAIIDMVVKEKLFSSPLDFNEHYMTLARHALVNKEIFAFLATQTRKTVYELDPSVDLRTKKTTITEKATHKHLHDFLFRQPSQQLASQRTTMLRHYKKIEPDVTEALKRSKDWPWADLLHLNSPKWASDVFESTIGAVFIDSGASLDACRKVLEKLGLVTFVERAAAEPDMDYRQKREVLRLARPGRVKFESQKYRDDDDSRGAWTWRCVANIDGEAAATVEGCSCEAEAEERAAVEALQQLHKFPAKEKGDEIRKEKGRKRPHIDTDVDTDSDALDDDDLDMRHVDERREKVREAAAGDVQVRPEAPPAVNVDVLMEV